MTSSRQIEANRRNAQLSTGPVTEEGKKRSRQNAVRHGLTAETVIDALEDAEDYAAFEMAVMTDYDAQSAVKRELVLSKIQARHLQQYRQQRRTHRVRQLIRDGIYQQLMALGESVRYLGIIDASKPSDPVFIRGLQSVRKHTLFVVLQKAAHAGVHYVRSIGDMVTAWKNSARLSRGMPLAPSAVHGRYRFIFGKAVKRYRPNPIPETLSRLQGATRKNSMMPVGDAHAIVCSDPLSSSCARSFAVRHLLGKRHRLPSDYD